MLICSINYSLYTVQYWFWWLILFFSPLSLSQMIRYLYYIYRGSRTSVISIIHLKSEISSHYTTWQKNYILFQMRHILPLYYGQKVTNIIFALFIHIANNFCYYWRKWKLIITSVRLRINNFQSDYEIFNLKQNESAY
jgi:hypothetical protein